MNRAACFTLIAIGVALGTWAVGWWAVPIVALIAGFARCGAGIVSAATAMAWLVLLLIDVASGSIGRLAGLLAGVMGLPAVALFVVTLALPALLGWSAATLGAAARSVRPTSRQPS
jgi:hypothetical protein